MHSVYKIQPENAQRIQDSAWEWDCVYMYWIYEEYKCRYTPLARRFTQGAADLVEYIMFILWALGSIATVNNFVLTILYIL